MGSVCLSKKQYLHKVFSEFSIDKSAELVTKLLAPHINLNFQLPLCTNKEREFMAQVTYASVISNFIYTISVQDETSLRLSAS